MLPVIDFPPLVKRYGGYFKPYFSKPQYIQTIDEEKHTTTNTSGVTDITP